MEAGVEEVKQGGRAEVRRLETADLSAQFMTELFADGTGMFRAEDQPSQRPAAAQSGGVTPPTTLHVPASVLDIVPCTGPKLVLLQSSSRRILR